MVDISALMRVLPVSALEPDWVASLGGFIDVPKDRDWQERIGLLEPPAGQRAPYIEPVGALEKLLRRQSVGPEDAKARALEAVARMREDVAEDHWVNFFDDLKPESPDCLPLPDFLAWLRKEMLVPSDILDFFEQAAEVTVRTPMFRGPDNWDEPWSLESLPALPPPKAMIEFVPGPPWDDIEWGDWETGDNPFLRWREAMRPVAQELEKSLGEPVYYFKELGDELDDDDVHRFLVLHWCCTHKPESAFVRYLLKISGARDVEELKAALIDPASYTQPFKMNCSFFGLEASPCCHFDYLPPGKQQAIDGIVAPVDRNREEWQDRRTQGRAERTGTLQDVLVLETTAVPCRKESTLPVDQIDHALTEEDAVTIFAKAWNRLEPDGFLALLAPDARYASQWVFEELVGAEAITDYLRAKMKTVRNMGVNNLDSRVRVEIGRTAHGKGGRPCAFMTQGRGNTVQAAVAFEVKKGKVVRYDLCIPQILGAVRTGVFPI